MTSRFWVVPFVSALVVLVVAAITLPARGQSAAAPTYSVGDTWVRKIGSEMREVKVTKVEEGGTWFTGGRRDCQTCLTFFDKNLTLLRVTDASGKDVDVTQMNFVPLGSNWKLYDFPLEVKKTWSFTATGYSRGRTGTYKADNVVEAYEDAKTPAGTLKAFRIGRRWTLEGQGTGGTFRVNWKDIFWFAPDTKSIVKFTSDGRNAEEWELASYSLK